MLLREDGKPYIYVHQCDPSEVGRELSREEIVAFATDCLVKTYEMKGYNVIRHTEDFNSGADFSFTQYGKTYLGKVVYSANDEEKHAIYDKMYARIPDTDFAKLRKGHDEKGSSPIAYFAKIKCHTTNGGKFVAGGDYEIYYYPFEWMYEYIEPDGEYISEYEMYKGYAESWVSGDTTFMRKYVRAIFIGQSELSFDDITSKPFLLELVEHEHAKWEERGCKLSYELVRDTDNDRCGILMKINNKNIAFVSLNFSEFSIASSHTYAPPKSYETWNGKHELYQTHGDHHAPFVDDDELMNFVKDMLQDSSVYCVKQTDVTFDNNRKLNTQVFCSNYANYDEIYPDEIEYRSMSAVNKEEKHLEFITCFPYLEGVPTVVTILEVLEWDNQVEATIKCRFENGDESFDFHFFATDYLYHKDRYKIGKEIEIGLAASCGNAKVASKGFDFEGQKAIDFLSKLGEEPDYDDNGNVKPLHFSTEKMVMYMANDEKCPDMGTFQSPTDEYKYREGLFNGGHFCIDTITLNTATNLKVPLYYNDDCGNTQGEGITGWLWLTGRLSNPTYTKDNGVPTEVQETFLEIVKQFVNTAINLTKRTLANASNLLHCLKHIAVDEGTALYTLKVGKKSRYHFQLICVKPDEVFHLLNKIDSDGFISEAEAMELPSLLERIHVDKTKSSVWEAFLLDVLFQRYMPFECDYFDKKPIITKGMVSNLPALAFNDCTHDTFYPDILAQNDRFGFVSIYSWHKGEIVRDVYAINKNDDQVRFKLDGSYTVYPLLNSIKHTENIRFRDGD
jgi:hypothetical protein